MGTEDIFSPHPVETVGAWGGGGCSRERGPSYVLVAGQEFPEEGTFEWGFEG